MSLFEIWRKAILRVAACSGESYEQESILLLFNRVFLVLDGTKIRFICCSGHVYNVFATYAMRFFDEVVFLLEQDTILNNSYATKAPTLDLPTANYGFSLEIAAFGEIEALRRAGRIAPAATYAARNVSLSEIFSVGAPVGRPCPSLAYSEVAQSRLSSRFVDSRFAYNPAVPELNFENRYHDLLSHSAISHVETPAQSPAQNAESDLEADPARSTTKLALSVNYLDPSSVALSMCANAPVDSLCIPVKKDLSCSSIHLLCTIPYAALDQRSYGSLSVDLDSVLYEPTIPPTPSCLSICGIDQSFFYQSGICQDNASTPILWSAYSDCPNTMEIYALSLDFDQDLLAAPRAHIPAHGFEYVESFTVSMPDTLDVMAMTTVVGCAPKFDDLDALIVACTTICVTADNEVLDSTEPDFDLLPQSLSDDVADEYLDDRSVAQTYMSSDDFTPFDLAMMDYPASSFEEPVSEHEYLDLLPSLVEDFEATKAQLEALEAAPVAPASVSDIDSLWDNSNVDMEDMLHTCSLTQSTDEIVSAALTLHKDVVPQAEVVAPADSVSSVASASTAASASAAAPVGAVAMPVASAVVENEDLTQSELFPRFKTTVINGHNFAHIDLSRNHTLSAQACSLVSLILPELPSESVLGSHLYQSVYGLIAESQADSDLFAFKNHLAKRLLDYTGNLSSQHAEISSEDWSVLDDAVLMTMQWLWERPCFNQAVKQAIAQYVDYYDHLYQRAQGVVQVHALPSVFYVLLRCTALLDRDQMFNLSRVRFSAAVYNHQVSDINDQDPFFNVVDTLLSSDRINHVEEPVVLDNTPAKVESALPSCWQGAKGSPVDSTKTLQNFAFSTYNHSLSNALLHCLVDASKGDSSHQLFISADQGLGKSHLLMAAVNMFNKSNAGHKHALYITASDFKAHFLNAINFKRNNRAVGMVTNLNFRELYSKVSVLCVDDVQDLAGAERTIEALREICADFALHGKSVILASRLDAKTLSAQANLRPDFVSFLCSGLVFDIKQPNASERLEILKMMAKDLGLSFSSTILHQLANHSSDNPREILGVLKNLANQVSTRVNALVSQTKRLNKASAKERQQILLQASAEQAAMLQAKWQQQDQQIALNLSASVEQAKQVTLDDLSISLSAHQQYENVDHQKIRTIVCEAFKVRNEDLESKTKRQVVCRARGLAMTLMRDLMSLSLNDIGALFKKDHSSVHEAIKRTRVRMDSDLELKSIYENTCLRFRGCRQLELV